MTKITRVTILAIWAAVAVPMTVSSPTDAQTLRDPTLQVQQVVAGLTQPTNMAFIGPNDILILQKGDGRVRRVVGGTLQPGEVLDVAVDRASERGLLGIAVHPGFPAMPFLYLYYTESSTGADTAGSATPAGNRVYRYTWNGSALVSPSLIADLPVTPGPNHDGGIITFGPDGKLYVVIGDLNRDGRLQNIPDGETPDDTSVILRLNDDGSIPSDNPFSRSGGNLAKYYAYGIRNSFGMTFDTVTGRLWMTENGPESYDEINMVLPGFNSGWKQLMGPDARDPQSLADLFVVSGSHYRDPAFSWFDPVGVTAIVFFDSALLGDQYENDAFVGDINNGNLYRFNLNATRSGFNFVDPALADLVADDAGELDEPLLGTGFGGITDLKVGPDGRLYVLSFGQGKLFVISRLGLTLEVSPTETQAGSTVTATWSGIPNPTSTDWIGLFQPGAQNPAFLDWMYVSCSKTPGAAAAAGFCPLVIPAGLAPGPYELRLLANNGFTSLAAKALTVTASAPTLSVTPTQVSRGGTVTATWSGIPNPTSTDWIGLFEPGAQNPAFLDWMYVSCSKTPGAAAAAGSCPLLIPAGLAPGPYELRLLANNGFTSLAAKALTVTASAPTLSVTPTQVSRGGTVTATWSGILNPTSTDWIGLFEPGAQNPAFLDWMYVSCSKTPDTAAAAGSCPLVIPAALTPGSYELRLLAADGFSHLAVSGTFTVSP
jgi:glucose/arabinose dehydrogenase